MSRKGLVLLVGLVLAAGAAFVALKMQRRDNGLVLSGTVEARDVDVGSLLGGRVKKIHIDEGSSVSAGQPLVEFETDLIDPQIQQQEARIAEARANLDKAVHGPRIEVIASARATAENTERERIRQKALLDQGLAPQQAYDSAATQAKTAAEALRELERGSRPEDIAAARAALDAAGKQLGYLQRQKAESVVTAPAAGIIESMDLRPGDLVAANQPVARMLEPSQLWVRVYVPEPLLGRVRIGQKAAVTVDTFPGRAFPGHVTEIRTQAEYTPRNVQTLDQRMDQVFGVRVEIEPSGELRPGMAASVRLQEP